MKPSLAILAAVASLSTFSLAHAAGASAPTEKLSSGVTVEQITKGTGATPKASDVVKVHYRGTLTDGKEFDSSYKRGQPISFPLNRVIPCWTEGVQRMQVGGKAKLTCPGPTAYGSRGIPGTIPPNATLLFDVELIGIGG